MKNIRRAIVAALLGIPLLLPAEARAIATGACDPDLPGLCTISVQLTGNTLTITLANTSPAANGGYITADAFNIGTAQLLAGSFSTTDSGFGLFGSTSVSPYGTRDTLISSTNGQWLGGGSPSGGIGVGEAATFTLSFASLGGLTEHSVLASSLVRFRGFLDGDSDKDLVTRVAMPEIGSLPLLVLGLTGLGVLWRRSALRRHARR